MFLTFFAQFFSIGRELGFLFGDGEGIGLDVGVQGGEGLKMRVSDGGEVCGESGAGFGGSLGIRRFGD